MTSLGADPLMGLTITEFGRRLRRGEITAELVTRAYLDRIASLSDRVGAYLHVARDKALSAARAIDQLLSAGTDLGPLMGVPVSLKDLFFVKGMPTRAGSRVDVSDLVSAEGTLVNRLRRLGCILIGKTVQSEFALAANLIHEVPWNPCDMNVKRLAGTSSSGSAAAMAANLSIFTVGTDTGGSVRQPAALCGIFGYKASVGFLPTDGAMALAPTMDSIGIFTGCADDAATVVSQLAGVPLPPARDVRGLRFGRPAEWFFDDLDRDVAVSVDEALTALEKAGAEFAPVEVPEARDIGSISGRLVPAELLAVFGRERLLRSQSIIDPVAWDRIAGALDFLADEYIKLLRRHHELVAEMRDRMQGFDAWVVPTLPLTAPPVTDLDTVEKIKAWNVRANDNVRPVNLFGQCAVSIPVQHFGAALPVGLQLICPPMHDLELLAIARGVERVLGRPAPPNLADFL